MKKIKQTVAVTAAALALFAVSTAAHAEGSADKAKLTASTSVNYSTGDYGQTIDTNILYVPVTAKAKYDNWTMKLTVPYIRITGPGVVVGGDGGDPLGAAQAKSTESGLGDILASLGYKFKLNTQGTSADLTGKVKLPTADEKKRLGTGNTDYTLQAGLTQAIGSAFVNGSVGRKFNGSSAQFRLNDVWKYSVGGGYNFNPGTVAGVSYDFRQGATATSKNFSQAMAYVTYDLTSEIAAQVYGAKGYSNATPDTSVGVQLSYKFDSFDPTSND